MSDMSISPSKPGAKPKILLLHNPAAGPLLWAARRRKHLQRLQNELQRLGAHVDRGEIPKACTLAREGYDAAIVAGGDGSFSMVARALHSAKSTTPILLAACGTSNVLRYEYDWPLLHKIQGHEILEALAQGNVRPFYPGVLTLDDDEAQQFPFFLMAGIGFCAKVLSASPFWLKRIFGRMALALSGIYILLRRQLHFFDVEWQGRSMHTCWAITSKIRHYAGAYPLFSAMPQDPAESEHSLHLCIFQSKHHRDLFKSLLDLLRGHFEQSPYIRIVHLDGTRDKIGIHGIEYIQLDGDCLLAKGQRASITVAEHPLHLLQCSNKLAA